MKKMCLILLITMLSLCFSISVFALEPPTYSAVSTDTAEELASWIAVESADTFQEGRFKSFLTTYREKGELLVGYYPDDSDIVLHHNIIEATPNWVLYQNSHSKGSVTIMIRLINPKNEHLLEESLSAYLAADRGVEFKNLPTMETTIGSGETVSYVLVEYKPEIQNGINYAMKNVHFIKDGYEISVCQKNYCWDMKYVNQLQLMKLPIKKASELKGYGDVLISRNYLEGGFWSEDEVSQNGRNTEKELQEYVERYIERNRGSSFGVDWKIINAEFAPAVAGTREEPKGKDGYYTFQISLSKEKAQNIVTKPLTVTIKARELRNITGFQTEEQQVTANVVQAEDSVNQLMIVAYKDNMMLEAKTVDAVGTDEITTQIPKDANRVKAFLWEKPEQPEAQTYKLRSITPTYALSLNPQCPAWELTKNEQGEWE